MVRDKPGHDSARLRRELMDMTDIVARSRRDVATSVAEAAGGAVPSLDRAFEDLIAVAEQADSDVFNAAERVQEIVWSLRDGGVDGAVLDELNRQALEIYRASNQHALTTNRARSLVATLRQLETRIAAIVGSWSEDVAIVETSAAVGKEARRDLVLDTAPPRIREDIAFVDRREAEAIRRRSDVEDQTPGAPAAPAAVAPPRTAAAPMEAKDPRIAAFAAFDALSTEDKLALFA